MTERVIYALAVRRRDRRDRETRPPGKNAAGIVHSHIPYSSIVGIVDLINQLSAALGEEFGFRAVNVRSRRRVESQCRRRIKTAASDCEGLVDA